MSTAEQLQETKKGPKLTIKEVAGRLDKVVDSTNDAMEELKSSMSEQAETNRAILEMMKAKNNPVSFNKPLDAAEQDLGDVADVGDSPIISGYFDINSPAFQEKAGIEKFMQEKVKIHIHESNNDMEVDTFMASVNNKPVMFRFGETKIVPRYIVEVLARAKPISYSNVEKFNADGVRVVVNKGSRGLRYPFSVVEDSQVGKSWLNLVLAQQ